VLRRENVEDGMRSEMARGDRPVIRITPMILEICPDLSQRVYPDRKSSNNAKNVT
jgi:hypothetical protein